MHTPVRFRGLIMASCLVMAAAGLTAGASATEPPSPTVQSQVGPHAVATPDGLLLENTFVSSVGWVKPGESYPSRIIVTNPTDTAVSDVTVDVAAPTGTSFTGARTAGSDVPVTADLITWTAGDINAGGQQTLVVISQTDTQDQTPTIVWRDLSTTATASTATGGTATVDSHGPKVIPPGKAYDTARYGDRPFPVVPVAYNDRDWQDFHSGDQLADVINSPDHEGSTFNLFQEISLGQLYPHGTVPSAGVDTAGFDYEHGFEFTRMDTDNPDTCTGITYEDTPLEEEGTLAWPERISGGVYQLPGSTGYYGQDGAGSGLIGALTGVGALMKIDSGCGPTGKLVYDSAAIADPEIDYSDYDTDKDGLVDFFMVVFAGCGGHGASQLTVATCPYPDAPYDNIWPHSSSLEYYYTDPETGLPGYTSDDQLKDLEGQPLYYTAADRREMTTTVTDWPVFVRVGPYNVNPETALDAASVISHEYGHSLGLPDFYSLGSRDTYGDWNLMATDKSHHMDVFSRQEMGWIVPEVLEPGTNPSVTGWTDSKEDTDTITWQTPDGTEYSLQEGVDGRVQNAQSYVAKLPGRVLLDPERFNAGEGASATHTWWSGSGNDFGCAADGGGHNIDLMIPGLADLPSGSSVDLSFKSMFDIEWDYDYGFVLTSTDGGQEFASNESIGATPTTSTTNPNQNGCQATYSNGISGTSTSYAGGTVETDRLLGTYDEAIWITDRFDVSELAGAEMPVLRFSYATDPGLARPGWFIDDVTVTATLPDGSTQDLFVSDFESDGGPDDGRIFNGGCQGDMPGGSCTQGWSYVNAGAEAPNDHAYYMELRDRSGFDLDGRGQNDRADINFLPGLSLVYTDEAHGYGNVGTDDPPAQSPLDSQPEPGSNSPDLSDAAFTAEVDDTSFSDWGEGHTDNYSDPSQTEVDARYPDEDNPWRFRYDCLSFDVTSMDGTDLGPVQADGNLTGDVDFAMGTGCGEFDWGHGDVVDTPDNTAPVAAIDTKATTIQAGRTLKFDAGGSTDAETPEKLDYTWDFGDTGRTKDASGEVARHQFTEPGTWDVTVLVTDPQGLTDTATVTITVE